MAGRDWSEGSDSSIEEIKLCVGGGKEGGEEGGGETDVCVCVCMCVREKGRERSVCEGEEKGMCVRGKGEGCM